MTRTASPLVNRLQRQAYHRTELSNGLRIVSAPRPYSESLTIGIWIGVGGRYENKRMNGVSHFLEHLLFKGTTGRSYRDIKETIEGAGGVFNAFTDEEFTCIWAKVQPKRLTLTLEVLTDMVLHSVFLPKEVEKERQVIQEEIRMYRDLPMQSVHDLLHGLLWQGHPLGMLLSGTEESVGRLRREDILSFQKKFYTPKNIVISACGRLNHRELVEAVKKWWDKQPGRAVPACARIRGQQTKPRFQFEKKETEQTHIGIGFHAFPRSHPHVQALNLLNIILGGNMSSRLFQKVREERGLAYEIGSGVKRYRDTGFFSVGAGVEHRHTASSVRMILKEFNRICREPVTKKEFEQAIEFFIGQMLFGLEDTVEHMCWIGESEMLLGCVEPVEMILQQVERVRPRDLTIVARQILNDRRLNMAVIGPVPSAIQNKIKNSAF